MDACPELPLADAAADPSGDPAAAIAAPPGEGDWREGLAQAHQQRWAEAARAFARATRAAPRDRVYRLNLAHALQRSGAALRALAAVRRCLQQDPADELALRLKAECLTSLQRHAEAAEVLATLAADGRSEVPVQVEHAASLLALQRPRQAAQVLLQALSREPAHTAAHLLLADALRDQGLPEEALECLITALTLDPADLQARSLLSFYRRQLCDWTEFADGDDPRAPGEARQGGGALETALCRLPAGKPSLVSVFGLLSLPLPPALLLRAARARWLALTAGLQPLPAVAAASRVDGGAGSDQGTAQGGRIRLGFVSHDFRDHPVAQLLCEMLASIDRERFEIFLYSSGPDDGSPLLARLVALAQGFVDLRALGDHQAAARIRADRIDLLIDLMGHTRGQRPAIFAYRPAPLQAGFLGYPGSTGADAIDYLICDPIVAPLTAAADFSEKLAQLPLTVQPNGRDRPLPLPMRRADAGLPEGAFVLCAFHPPYKIIPEVFALWCGLLRELPDAVLWLRDAQPPMRRHLLREAALRGVAPERLVFAQGVPREHYFSRLALADVFVDTWPYNAHTTAADALWAGVPVVTRWGGSYASRVAASVLEAAGLGGLAFGTAAEYRDAVLTLALDDGLRGDCRRHLETQRMQLPLFDAQRFAREFEALATRMVQRWRRGEPCAHLPAASVAAVEVAAVPAAA